MKPYEIKCLIIIIIISILYLFLHCSKKETFENLDSFIKSTNNGKWNFASYNPYSELHNFSDVFYIINDVDGNALENMSYNERLKYNKEELGLMNTDSNNKLLIEKILNKYNNSTNSVSIQDVKYTKFGLAFNYRVLLINAFDKLNYVKNKAKLKSLINTSLIKDIKLYYINKYIEKLSITNEYDADNNIVVELKYKFKKNSTIFDASNPHNRNYVNHILNEIKNYLKMDIINNGTSDNPMGDNSDEIHYKFKIIAYKLDENEKQVVNDNITKLYNKLFTEILNKNDNNNILKKLNLPNNEKYVRNICVWKSGLCSTSTNVKIMPICSVPSAGKETLNRYTISYNDTTSSYNISDNQKNLNGWKNHIINGIMGNKNSNTYNCNIYDINYNINGSQLFTLDLYDDKDHKKTKTNIFAEPSPWKKGPTSDFASNEGRTTFNSQFNVNAPTQTLSCPQGSVTSSKTNVDSYMKSLGNIKGLNVATQNNVKAILLAEQTLTDFNNYKRDKSKKEVTELKKLRLFGKVFKLLDEYKTIEPIDSSIKTKLDSMIEGDDITKDKLYAVLHLIMERHLREKNEEFKLNELLLSDGNTTTKKRYEIIKEKIPETNQSKSLKLRYMTTTERINYFDKKSNRIEEELTMIEAMTNEEVALYFKEINELFTDKDVNYRLKRIIDSNKSNISRIHKKLNSLSGGLIKKMTGGSIVPPGSFSGSVGVGTTLLLNEYRDLSLSYVTSTINDLAYYKGYIYVVGNSGYFSKYNLTTNNGIGESIKITNNRFTNLNSIAVSNNGICVVGDKATILYSPDKINFTYKTLKQSGDNTRYENDLLEVYIKDSRIYIIGENIRCTITTNNIKNDGVFDNFNQHTGDGGYSNIFEYKYTKDDKLTPLVCCLKKANDMYSIIDLKSDDTGIGILNDTLKIVKRVDSSFVFGNTDALRQTNVEKIKSLYLKNNETTNILVFHYRNDLYIYELKGNFVSPNHTLLLEAPTFKKIVVDASEKINSVYVDNSSVGILTNKLKYYQYQQYPLNNTIENIDLTVTRVGNFTTSKIVHIDENTNNYTNIYHFGNAGKIFYYNINNKHKTGLKLNYQPSGATNSIPIIPLLNGIDRKKNNIYVVTDTNSNFKSHTKFTVNYPNLPPPTPDTDGHELDNTTLYLSGNTNIHKVDNDGVPNAINKENITLLKFDYTPTKDDTYNTTDNTKLYSVRKPKKIPLDITNIQLLSNEITVEVDRNKERNRNEFVSMAVLINGKFKIWLKPKDISNIYEFNYTFSKLDNEDKYELVKYRNGIFMNKYTLKVADTNSTKIANILYNGENIRFDKNIKTLYLDTIITSNNYNLTIIPESKDAAVIYNKKKITSETKNIDIVVEKKQNTIDVGIMNGNLYENHKIIINSKELKKITELKDYESQYLLDLLIDEAFEYLNKVNNTDRTLQFLLKKYRLNKKDEVQEFLGLITDKNTREILEHKFVNQLNDTERIDYIKNYLNKDKPVKKVKEVKKVEPKKVDTMMSDLKIKLDKMKIEKEILANQFKIEQRNRLFEKGQGIVSKTDIAKMDSRISDINNMIDESKKNKSKSFIDKILGFFSSDKEEEKKMEDKLKEIEEAKIKKAEDESEKKIKELEDKNKLKLEKLEKKLKADNLEKINKLKEETNAKLKEQEDAKKENELLAEKEKNELELKKNDLNLEQDRLKEDKIKNEMNNLFDVQKNLLKKQKLLLKTVNTSDKKLIEDIIKTNIITEKTDKKTDKSEKSKKGSKKNQIIQKSDIKEIIEEEEINAEEKLIEKSIMKEMNEEIMNEKMKKKEMKKKKGKQPCVSFIDCYFKNLDDNFYTSYKNDYTFIKNAELPKEKQPACKPKKDCDICYLNTNGVPESINYNSKAKNTMVNMPKNISIMGNDNVIYNVNVSQKNMKEMDNDYFKNNYEDLPDCPFDPCMSCDNNNKYKSVDNAFNDKLIEKYRVKK